MAMWCSRDNVHLEDQTTRCHSRACWAGLWVLNFTKAMILYRPFLQQASKQHPKDISEEQEQGLLPDLLQASPGVSADLFNSRAQNASLNVLFRVLWHLTGWGLIQL